MKAANPLAGEIEQPTIDMPEPPIQTDSLMDIMEVIGNLHRVGGQPPDEVWTRFYSPLSSAPDFQAPPKVIEAGTRFLADNRVLYTDIERPPN